NASSRGGPRWPSLGPRSTLGAPAGTIRHDDRHRRRPSRLIYRRERAMRPQPKECLVANHKVADLKLADAGRLRIDWAETRMPVLMALREKGKQDKPLRGMKVAGCLHVTKETAVLIRTIIAAGAEVSWSGCNPLSTNDEVAAALAADGVSIYAWHGLSNEEFYWCIERTLDFGPTLTLDDGADLIFTVHNKHKHLVKDIVGGTEETTTGVDRLRAMADDGKLLY